MTKQHYANHAKKVALVGLKTFVLGRYQKKAVWLNAAEQSTKRILKQYYCQHYFISAYACWILYHIFKQRKQKEDAISNAWKIQYLCKPIYAVWRELYKKKDAKRCKSVMAVNHYIEGLTAKVFITLKTRVANGKLTRQRLCKAELLRDIQKMNKTIKCLKNHAVTEKTRKLKHSAFGKMLAKIMNRNSARSFRAKFLHFVQYSKNCGILERVCCAPTRFVSEIS